MSKTTILGHRIGLVLSAVQWSPLAMSSTCHYGEESNHFNNYNLVIYYLFSVDTKRTEIHSLMSLHISPGQISNVLYRPTSFCNICNQNEYQNKDCRGEREKSDMFLEKWLFRHIFVELTQILSLWNQPSMCQLIGIKITFAISYVYWYSILKQHKNHVTLAPSGGPIGTYHVTLAPHWISHATALLYALA